MCFYRWFPESKDKLKIMVRVSGQAACTHFSSQYLTLLGPGAKESAAVLRASVTSSTVMGGHSCSGSGSRLPS